MRVRITTSAQASQALCEIDKIARPIQCGNQPYLFDLDELEEAVLKGLAIVRYATRRFRGMYGNDIWDHPDGDLLGAYRRTRSIIREIIKDPRATNRQKRKASKQQEKLSTLKDVLWRQVRVEPLAHQR